MLRNDSEGRPVVAPFLMRAYLGYVMAVCFKYLEGFQKPTHCPIPNCRSIVPSPTRDTTKSKETLLYIHLCDRHPQLMALLYLVDNDMVTSMMHINSEDFEIVKYLMNYRIFLQGTPSEGFDITAAAAARKDSTVPVEVIEIPDSPAKRPSTTTAQAEPSLPAIIDITSEFGEAFAQEAGGSSSSSSSTKAQTGQNSRRGAKSPGTGIEFVPPRSTNRDNTETPISTNRDNTDTPGSTNRDNSETPVVSNSVKSPEFIKVLKALHPVNHSLLMDMRILTIQMFKSFVMYLLKYPYVSKEVDKLNSQVSYLMIWDEINAVDNKLEKTKLFQDLDGAFPLLMEFDAYCKRQNKTILTCEPWEVVLFLRLPSSKRCNMEQAKFLNILTILQKADWGNPDDNIDLNQTEVIVNYANKHNLPKLYQLRTEAKFCRFLTCLKCFGLAFHFSSVIEALNHVRSKHSRTDPAQMVCGKCGTHNKHSPLNVTPDPGSISFFRHHFDKHRMTKGHFLATYGENISKLSAEEFGMCPVCALPVDSSHIADKSHVAKFKVLEFFEEFCSHFRFSPLDMLPRQTYKFALLLMIAHPKLRKIHISLFDLVLQRLLPDTYTPLVEDQHTRLLPFCHLFCFACKVPLQHVESLPLHLQHCQPQDQRNQLLNWQTPFFFTEKNEFFSKNEIQEVTSSSTSLGKSSIGYFDCLSCDYFTFVNETTVMNHLHVHLDLTELNFRCMRCQDLVTTELNDDVSAALQHHYNEHEKRDQAQSSAVLQQESAAWTKNKKCQVVIHWREKRKADRVYMRYLRDNIFLTPTADFEKYKCLHCDLELGSPGELTAHYTTCKKAHPQVKKEKTSPHKAADEPASSSGGPQVTLHVNLEDKSSLSQLSAGHAAASLSAGPSTASRNLNISPQTSLTKVQPVSRQKSTESILSQGTKRVRSVSPHNSNASLSKLPDSLHISPTVTSPVKLSSNLQISPSASNKRLRRSTASPVPEEVQTATPANAVEVRKPFIMLPKVSLKLGKDMQISHVTSPPSKPASVSSTISNAASNQRPPSSAAGSASKVAPASRSASAIGGTPSSLSSSSRPTSRLSCSTTTTMTGLLRPISRSSSSASAMSRPASIGSSEVARPVSRSSAVSRTNSRSSSPTISIDLSDIDMDDVRSLPADDRTEDLPAGGEAASSEGDTEYMYLCTECEKERYDCEEGCNHLHHPRVPIGNDLSEHLGKTGHMALESIDQHLAMVDPACRILRVENISFSRKHGKTVRRKYKELVVGGEIKSSEYTQPRKCLNCGEYFKDAFKLIQHIQKHIE